MTVYVEKERHLIECIFLFLYIQYYEYGRRRDAVERAGSQRHAEGPLQRKQADADLSVGRRREIGG